MKTALIPYLNFNGIDTATAMKFYQGIFGGELKMSTFEESGMAKNDTEKDYIMHAELKTEDFSFMASSGQPGIPIKFGDSVSLSLIGTDEAGLTEKFNKLSVGGEITMKLEKQFWGDIFGMLTDKFGIQWMVNITAEEGEKNK
jgi:PhnB protein